MKISLLKYWDRLRTNFWFVPAAMALLALALSFGSVALDRAMAQGWASSSEWVYAGGAEGARAVLQTIAGSMITVAGVVFSLTLVTLSMASSQFGTRLLRNFMRDTMNQVVLGTFVSTFLFCLLVLRTIRFDEGDIFVPHLSITLGILFAVASIGVLIYFIHHVALLVQADEVVARVSGELMGNIDDLFPEQIGEGADERASGNAVGGNGDARHGDREPALPNDLEGRACDVVAACDGYLQLIDAELLMELAQEADLLLLVKCRPGDYLIAGSPLARLWPAKTAGDDVKRRIEAVFVIGEQRTPVQDIDFAVGQLVEIAVRALSPGMNDPFTAVICVDRLGAALCRLAQRKLPSPYRYDDQGRLRVVAPTTGFAEILDAAFNDIRVYARSSVAVTRRMLRTLAVVAGFVRRSEDRLALHRQAEMIVRGSAGFDEENDRVAVNDDYRQLLGRLEMK